MDQVKDALVGGKVAFGGHFAADIRVSMVVEVVGVQIEDGVAAQPERLMHLKIKADRRHGVLFPSLTAMEDIVRTGARMTTVNHAR